MALLFFDGIMMTRRSVGEETALLFGRWSPLFAALLLSAAGTGLGILFIALRGGAPLVRRIALLLGGLLVSLALAETILSRHFIDPPGRMEVTREMRMKGEDVFPFFNPVIEFNNNLLLTVYPRTRVIEGAESGRPIEYVTDRFGLKNPDELLDVPAPFEVLMIGDSYGQGYSTGMDETISAYLIRKHSLRVYNASVAGSGPLQQLSLLRRFLPVARPQTVVWSFFGGNDFSEVVTEFSYPSWREAGETGALEGHWPVLSGDSSLLDSPEKLKARILEDLKSPSDRPFFRSFGGQTLSGRMAAWLEHRKSFYLLRHALKARQESIPPRIQVSPESARLVDRVLTEAARISREAGADFVLLYVPSPTVGVGDELPVSPDDNPRLKAIRMIAEKNKVNLIDILTRLRSCSDPRSLFFPIGPPNIYGHFNSSGNEFVADIVAKAIDETDSVHGESRER